MRFAIVSYPLHVTSKYFDQASAQTQIQVESQVGILDPSSSRIFFPQHSKAPSPGRPNNSTVVTKNFPTEEHFQNHQQRKPRRRISRQVDPNYKFNNIHNLHHQVPINYRNVFYRLGNSPRNPAQYEGRFLKEESKTRELTVIHGVIHDVHVHGRPPRAGAHVSERAIGTEVFGGVYDRSNAAPTSSPSWASDCSTVE
ncbi:stearoyl-CoA 9-desaturase [Naganishia albida]|nr:stearoyl-CoA 9-desaturase [Naganishia albida]